MSSLPSPSLHLPSLSLPFSPPYLSKCLLFPSLPFLTLSLSFSLLSLLTLSFSILFISPFPALLFPSLSFRPHSLYFSLPLIPSSHSLPFSSLPSPPLSHSPSLFFFTLSLSFPLTPSSLSLPSLPSPDRLPGRHSGGLPLDIGPHHVHGVGVCLLRPGRHDAGLVRAVVHPGDRLPKTTQGHIGGGEGVHPGLHRRPEEDEGEVAAF